MAANELRAEGVFNEARVIASPEERAAFLNRACADDDSLRRRVEALLSAHDLRGDMLDAPADLRDIGTAEYVEPRETLGSVVAGKYKLLQEIGRGGMGVVYMARQTEPVRRDVAVKIIQPGMDSQQVLARFEAERQALAMLDHPNVARVLDAGATDRGRPFFVMELIKGVPITQFCDEHRLPVRQRLDLFVAVCNAIQHAHQKGIIHRDVKPSNVLVAMYDDRPVPKIIDFGVAKATTQPLTERTLFTQYGAIVGTLEYMSPEQAKFNALDIDTRTDVYALGVLLYELLTGSTPIERSRLRSAAFDEMLRIIREEEPPTPSRRLSSTHELPSIAAQRGLEPRRLGSLIRGELDWIVMKCLEKDRGRRYETASSLASDVNRFLADEPVLAGPPSATYRLRKFVRRRKGAVVVALVALLGIAVSIAGQAWQLQREIAARREMQIEKQNAIDAKELESKSRIEAVRQKQIAESATKRLEAQKKLADVARASAVTARRQAEEERDAKNAAYLRADGLRLASESNAVRDSDPGLAVLIGLEAVEKYRHPLTFNALFEAKGASREMAVLDASQVGGAAHVRFLSQGRRLLTGGKNPQIGSAAIWDLETGKRTVVWHGYQLGVKDLAVRPDEQRIACAMVGSATVHYGDTKAPNQETFTSRVAYIWDAATGRDVVHCRGHEDSVVSVEFSSDGRKLLTGSHDQTARIWDADAGKTLHVLGGHENSLRKAFFSPDCKRAVTLSQEKWETNYGRVYGKKPPPVPADVDPGVKDQPIRGRSSASGSYYVVRGLEKVFARIWDVENGKQVGELEGPTFFNVRPWGDTAHATYSHDGKWIAVSFTTGRVGVWPAAGGQAVAFLTGHEGSVESFTFSIDDKRITSAGADLTVRTWDIEKKTEIKQVKVGVKPVKRLALSPNGRQILACAGEPTARLFDSKGDPVELRGHRGEILSGAFRPDGAVVATGDHLDVRLWSASRPPSVAKEVAVHGGPITAFAVSHRGDLVATGSRDATVQVFDLKSARQRWSSTQCVGTIKGLSFSDDDEKLFAATGLYREGEDKPLNPALVTSPTAGVGSVSTVLYWQVASGNKAGKIPTDSYGSRAAIPSTTGRVLVVSDGQHQTVKSSFLGVTVTTSGTASGQGVPQRIFDLASNGAPLALPPSLHDSGNAVFRGDGRSILVARGTGVIRQLSSTTGAREFEYKAKDENEMFGLMYVSPRDEYLLAISRWSPTKLSVWRTNESKMLREILLEGAVHSLHFLPDRKRFVICAGRTPVVGRIPYGDGSVNFVGHELDVTAAAYSQDGKLLLTGSNDRSAALWEMDTGKLIAVYRGHPGAVQHVAFAGDSQIVTASTDGILRFWPRDVLAAIRQNVRRQFNPAERQRFDLPLKSDGG